jgi:hypothetical protein
MRFDEHGGFMQGSFEADLTAHLMRCALLGR